MNIRATLTTNLFNNVDNIDEFNSQKIKFYIKLYNTTIKLKYMYIYICKI